MSAGTTEAPYPASAMAASVRTSSSSCTNALINAGATRCASALSSRSAGTLSIARFESVLSNSLAEGLVPLWVESSSAPGLVRGGYNCSGEEYKS